MDKLEIKITLPGGCEIPPAKMITLMKWFQKWVSPNIKKIHLERGERNGKSKIF